MKKIITAILACNLAYSYAQITLTKDLSFGNNGTVQLGTNTNSFYQLSYHNTPTFQGDKLFINQPIYDVSGSLVGRKFYRLNHNGSLDAAFGTNGEVTVSTTNYYSDSFYADTNKFYLDSGEKYFSNGMQDAGFGNINTPLANNDLSQYKIVLPDGKIISRNPQNIKKYQPTGALDTTYGNNGIVALDPLLENTVDDFGVLQHYDQNFLYEFVYSSNTNERYIRKISINTGNLDSSYGQNGYSDFYGTLAFPHFHLGSSFVPQSNNFFIHNTRNFSDGQLTRTNAAGILDIGFGVNGEINYPNSHIFNGNVYEIAEHDPILYGNYNFLLFSSFDTNGVGKFEFIGYDYSGSPITINNNLHYVFQGLDVADTLLFLVKDNYLYTFFDNKISRFIFAQSTLSTNEIFSKNASVNFNNPFKDELNFVTSEKIKSTEIYDEAGRLVLKNLEQKDINTSDLPKGVYFIKMTTVSNQVISKKGIKN